MKCRYGERVQTSISSKYLDSSLGSGRQMDKSNIGGSIKSLVGWLFGPKYTGDAVFLLKSIRRLPYALLGRPKELCNLPFVSLRRAHHHIFFGYYDLCPFHQSDDRHLALSVQSSFGKRSSAVAEIGYFHAEEPERFLSHGLTSLWNWQMGCRLQWYPNAGNDAVFYNALVMGVPGGLVYDLGRGEVLQELPLPIYEFSPDGRHGLSLDFFDLHKNRPGYGYRGGAWTSTPETAIWGIDVDTGMYEELVSYKDIWNGDQEDGSGSSSNYVNHLSYSPDGSHFLFLHIQQSADLRNIRLFVANSDGSNLRVVVESRLVSHYAWLGADHILCFSWLRGSGPGYYVYSLDDDSVCDFTCGSLTEDGHPGFFPDQQALITDTYPDRLGERHLLKYDKRCGQITELASYYSPFHMRGELRCDLHPRLDRSGTRVSVDTGHAGLREIRILDLTNVNTA